MEEKIKSLELENLTTKQNLALEKLLRNTAFSSTRAEAYTGLSNGLVSGG